MQSQQQSSQLQLPLFARCSDTFKEAEASLFGVEPGLECDRVQVCCGRRSDWPVLLQKLPQGYHLPCAETVAPIPSLPPIIHSIKGDLSHLDYLRTLEGMAWAVPYSRALAGDLKNADRLRKWLKHQELSSEQLILLHQETHDRELERLFPKTFSLDFFSTVSSASNCITISPGYSIYDNGVMCRHHQLYNLWRSVDFFVRANNYGVPCVPSLGWNRQEDLDTIAAWLKSHVTLHYVAINVQTLSRNQFAQVADAMSYLESSTRKLGWVVFGGPGISRYLNANGFAGRLHLVTATHIQKASAGRFLDASSRYPTHRKVDLFLSGYQVVAKTFDFPAA